MGESFGMRLSINHIPKKAGRPDVMSPIAQDLFQSILVRAHACDQ